MDEKEKRREAEDELLRASFMGDIREDVRLLGLSIGDITWIIAITLTAGGLPSALPVSVWVKIGSLFGVFFGTVICYWLKVPYRLRRTLHYWRQPKSGNGEQLIKLLGLEEDGWLYRSGKTLQVVVKVSAPPWQTAGFSQKRSRLSGFESFLRACAREGFSASITSEQVPDFRHEIWDRRRAANAPSEGLRELRLRRIALWEELVAKGEAQRSEYTLTLNIPEHKLDLRQREDEPEEAKSEELQRFRRLSDLRERLDRVLGVLQQGGHRTTLLSGYSIPELIGRWSDRSTWETWKQNQGTWELEQVPAEDKPTISKPKGVVLQKNEPEVEPQSAAKQVATIELEGTKEASTEDEAALDPETNHSSAVDPVDELSQVVEAVLQPARQRKGWNLLWLGELLRRVPWAVLLEQGKGKLSMLKSKLIAPLAWINRRREEPPEEAVPEKSLEHERPPECEAVQEMESLRSQTAPNQESMQSNPSRGWNGVKLITAPVPSGKSFVTANLGAAASLNTRRVTVVDLSPDRGCLTVLNPLKQPCDKPDWELWATHWADWQCYVPSSYPEPAAVCELLDEAAAAADLVLVEMPWNYPGKADLLQVYPALTVVDCDYHHWLRFVETGWQGNLLLNQSTPVMLPRMLSLLKEQELTLEAVIPYIPDAAYALYQGRPVALDPVIRQKLLDVTEGRGAENEHTEAYGAADQALA
ncbi:hypothetical protein [Paenibacillus graminis]|uniref:hypothetical protein n=1 Tax=Paenibacillus graminis TaxID=189425 RepID=UPI0030EBF615